MPPDVKSYPNFPSPATLRIENFHQAVGLIRCFDARRTDPDKRVRNPVADRPAAAAATGPVSFMTLHADSDDDKASPGGGGGGEGPAEGAGAAQAPGRAGGTPDED